MSDHITRALAPGVRIVAAITTELVEEGRVRHSCSPVASAALGRTMTAALLLSETIKADECITLRISGNGPLGDIVADTPLRHCVRGYVHHPEIDLPPAANGKLDVGAGVGEGMIHVARFSPKREVFTGTVKLISGEIAEDVTRYLLESEQIPSTVGLGVSVNPNGGIAGAAGFLVQAMPDVTEEILVNIERNLNLVLSPSHLAQEGMTAAGIIKLLTAGVECLEVFDSEPVKFKCTCSRDRATGILCSMEQDDIRSMIEEGKAEVRCNFCNESYLYQVSELNEFMNEQKLSFVRNEKKLE